MTKEVQNLRSDEEIGKRLKRLRIVEGKSQTKMAKLLGITQGAWSLFEQGKRLPGWPSARRLCDVFGVTLDWIFSGNIAQLPADLLERLQRGEAPDADPVDPKSVPEIGNRLASLRTNFNKTPAEMAGIIGTRRPDVWKEYEHGLRKIRMGHAERLCEEFEVSLDWIYLGDIKRLPIHLRKQLRPERTPRTDAHSTAGSEGI